MPKRMYHFVQSHTLQDIQCTQCSMVQYMIKKMYNMVNNIDYAILRVFIIETGVAIGPLSHSFMPWLIPII